jgi:hypothetical protein
LALLLSEVPNSGQKTYSFNDIGKNFNFDSFSEFRSDFRMGPKIFVHNIDLMGSKDEEFSVDFKNINLGDKTHIKKLFLKTC